MDNVKTGLFIKALRKEKSLTQRELAEILSITDRAVSKWERGLCAPDISLLEPLARALDVSIVELLKGERDIQTAYSEKVEEGAKNVIEYSKGEIIRKVGTLKRKYVGGIALCLVAVLVVCGAILWRGGFLFEVDKSLSPDGRSSITVYRKALKSGGFSLEDATSLIVREDGGESRITYGDCDYQGIWWAPDSRKYVLSLEYDSGTRLVLAWLDRNSESNLSAYLSFGVEMTELRKYGYANESGFPEIEYQFLQWGLDSASMLIYYAFEDREGALHEGYFWYNCETGAVSAIMELAP